MTIFSSNFTSNILSGTVKVSGGAANISFAIAPFALEGTKNFVVKLRRGSIVGDVLATSDPLTIVDTSTVVSLTANVSTISEGNLVSFSLITSNVPDTSTIFYSVFPVTANVTVSDFYGGNTGTVTINNNQATLALYANTDAGYVDETGEIFNVQLRTLSPQGNAVYTTSNVSILDAYKIYNILSFIESSTSVVEGTSVTFTFTGHNIPPGTVFYYATEGNATSSLFTTGNTGSFVMNTTSNTLTLNTTATVLSGETRSFAVKLREGSSTGTLYATSNTITVLDSSLAYASASGGTIIDSGGYRLHTFTSSDTLVINSLGAGPAYNTLDYLIVAGGAAGGRNGGGLYAGGGGGGAGGVLLGNIVASTGNTVITVGAGGSLVGFNEWPLPPGGNTTVVFAGASTQVAYGGGAGSHSWPDHGAGFGGARSGGSGGGGNTNRGFPAGTGTPGQGNPGGASSPLSYGGASGSFAGGGGGAGEAGHYQPTDSVSPLALTTQAGGNGIAVPWAPASYGTAGPAPGRYFGGGGGGGGSPNGSAYILSGGAGGGGAGGFGTGGYPTSAQGLGTAHGGSDGGANAVINTGGGGGGAGNGGASSGTGLAGKGGSGIVLIRYPYAPPTFSNVVTTSDSFITGSNITFTLNAINANAYTYYYHTDGNVTSADFIGGNTGSFTANVSGAVITLRTNATVPDLESRYFSLKIREDSLTGALKVASANIIIDGPSPYMLATGGTVIIDAANSLKIHVFTDSNTFNVTKLSTVSPTRNDVTYLSVAGGGGGGGTATGYWGSLGGAGAGGWVNGTFTATKTSSSIIVGAGGTGDIALGAYSYTKSTRGGNTSLMLPSGNVISVGGGSSAHENSPSDCNGGSGGTGPGDRWYSNPVGGSGYGYPSPTQQGYPGMPGTPGGVYAGGGGGAGAAGSSYTGGDGKTFAAPSAYGTPSPSPTLRYFAGGGGGGGGGDAIPIASKQGGKGGGGPSGMPGVANPGMSGNVNTGGGGGGGNALSHPSSTNGGAGGSGIVIIKYPYVA